MSKTQIEISYYTKFVCDHLTKLQADMGKINKQLETDKLIY